MKIACVTIIKTDVVICDCQTKTYNLMITKVEIQELLHSSRYVVENGKNVVENVVDNARMVVKDCSTKLTDK